jgi:uracil-DNA glycosylase
LAEPVRGTDYVPALCNLCALHKGRTQVVPGEGSATAKVFLVGEAPGPQEDHKGRPFIGRSGMLLRRTLKDTGWKEDEYWITNIVKCFPYNFSMGAKKPRAPLPEESDACRRHLQAEIEALKPRLFIALGKTAANNLTGRDVGSLDALHGNVVAARPEFGGTDVFLTFHPSGLHYVAGRPALFRHDLSQARKLWLARQAPA